MSEPRAVTFKTDDGLALEGRLELPATIPAPGLVVCHPHPLYGGEMRNNVVDALCRAALSSGFAALRFNFRGVGGSEGRYGQGVAEQNDARAALHYLRRLPEVDGERMALAGYSFGAAVSLRAADASLRGLVLVSLPTMMGRLDPPAGSSPVLLVSGDNDEYSDEDDLTAFAESMGERAELVSHRGVDHFWWGSDGRLVETVSAFLKRL